MAKIHDYRMAGADVETRAAFSWSKDDGFYIDFDYDEENPDRDSGLFICLTESECVSLYGALRKHLIERKNALNALDISEAK